MYRFGWLRDAGRMVFLCAMLLFTLGYSAAVGTYTTHTVSGNTINFTVTNGAVRIIVCTPSMVRVSFDTRGPTFTATDDVLSMADVNQTWTGTTPTVTDPTPGLTGNIRIATSAMVVNVAKNPFLLTYYKADGTTEITHETQPMNSNGSSTGTPAVCFVQTAAEHYYGWGAAFEYLRGTYRSIDNKAHEYHTRRSMALYMYSTGPSSTAQGYGIWLLFCEPYPSASAWGDITNPTQGCGFDLTGATAKFYMNPNSEDSYTAPMDYLSYYFCAGDWKTAMSNYTLASTRPPRLGKKFYGMMRDMYFHNNAPDNCGSGCIRPWIDMFRSNHFNMDWIRMDNFQDWTSLSLANAGTARGCWDAGALAAVQYCRSNGMYFGGMNYGWGYQGCCSPGCCQTRTDNVAAATTSVNNGYDWAWYDAMNYHGRNQSQAQWSTWLQAHGNDETKVMISRGWQSLSSHAWPGNHMGDYLNINSNNQLCVYDIFPATLLEHLVGYAWSHTDLGESSNQDWGYIGYTLRPMATIHMAGAGGNYDGTFQECGQIGGFSAAQKAAMVKWGNRRQRFIPFMFTYGMIAHETGIPPTRGMMCQNGGEWTAAAQSLGFQAYVGDELIWSPYYSDRPSNNTWLPAGVWYDFFPDGGQPAISYTGPTTITYNAQPASGHRLPVFVKANSIVPLGDSLEWVGQRPESWITLMVWPTDGSATRQTGSFTLYEDETPVKTTFAMTYYGDAPGTSYKSTEIDIGNFAGSKYCPTPASRNYRVVAHAIASPPEVHSGATNLTAITLAQINAGTAGYYWDAANGGMVHVNAAGTAQNAAFVIWIGPIVSVHSPAFDAVLAQKVSVIRHAGAVEVKVPFTGNHTVEILNAQGRLITKRTGSSKADYMISLDRQASMMYIVKVSAQGQSIVKRVTL